MIIFNETSGLQAITLLKKRTFQSLPINSLAFLEYQFQRKSFIGCFPCKARNRVGDNNRLHKNQCYEIPRISVVVYIDIRRCSYSYSNI